MLFTMKEEQGLRGFLEAWSLINRPLTRTVLLKYVVPLRKEFEDGIPVDGMINL